jgi:hypothetical protein
MNSNPNPPTTTPDVPGPSADGARKARRLAVVGAAALLIAAGGATAAYASGGDTVQTEYATIVDSGEGAQPETAVETPGDATPVGPESDQSSRPEDCPEKQGGAGQQGEGQQSTPETEAAPQAPDTSTL